MSLKEILTQEKIKQAFEKTVHEVTLLRGRLVLIQAEHHERVKQLFIEEIVPDYPVLEANGVGMSPIMHVYLTDYITQNMSIMIVNPDNDDIMAVRLLGVSSEKPSHVTEKATSEELESNENLKMLLGFWKYCDTRVDYFNKFGINEAINFSGLGVARKYRKQGLGMVLMEATMGYLKNLGVSPLYVKGTTVSSYAARIFDKLGFELLDDLQFKDYTVEGKQVVKCYSDHQSIRQYNKVL